MTTPVSKSLRENATRQAKRLSDRLDLPLTTSKELLARGPYRCSGWSDLYARLDAGESHTTFLASLPESSAAKSYFSKHLRELAQLFSQHVLTNSDLAGVYQTLRYVFGISEPVTLADIFTFIDTSVWQSSHIGPDPNAVIHAFTTINGVPMKLIGTRIYLPAYFQFGPEIESPDLAEPSGETLKIMWSNPQAWYDAAHAYLTAPEDDMELELSLPTEALDAAMQRHQQWFFDALRVWDMESVYGSGHEFVPYCLPHGCYLIFGIPCSHPSECPPIRNHTPRFSDDSENDRIVVLIDGQSICIEWISVDRKSRQHAGEYKEYFRTLQNGLLHHEETDLDLYHLNGWERSFFFLCPATKFDIDRLLEVSFKAGPGEEAFVVKSNSPELASILFDKVSARDAMRFPSERDGTEYAVKIDVFNYEETTALWVSLNSLGRNWESNHSLTTRSMCLKNESQKTLYVCVQPALFSLVDVIGKKALNDAVRFGLVLHRAEGFADLLEKAPKRCENIKLAPPEVVALFERPIWNGLDPFNLFRHLSHIRYSRDNF